jgi:poly(A) polymerase
VLFQLSEVEKQIFDKITRAARAQNVQAWVIGGFVRDRLLGRPSKDIDVVCVGNGIKLAEEVASQIYPRPKVSVFQKFGTAMLKVGDIEVEFVGARKESYRADSRKPSVENGTLEDDQNRRDFTINAMAISLNEADFGEIIDPFNGLRHLDEKILKTPLAPGQTFSDDPLRMMRAIRFAAQLDFTIEKPTLDGISKHKNRLEIVSPERILIELEKIIMSPKPSVGFNLLLETGLLALILPEMVALRGVEDRNGMAHKDNFYHTLEVLENVCRRSKDIWLRWAAIFHDIAKPPTKRFDPKIGWTFHGHEVVGARMVPQIFRRLKLPMDAKMEFVKKLVLLHLRPISLTKEQVTDSAIRRLLFDAGEDIESLLILCESDITSKNARKVARYLEGYELVKQRISEVSDTDRLRLWQPPITGEIIMETFGIPPSREVGILKTAVREAILDGEIANELDVAFELLLKKGAEMGLKVVV